MKKMAIGLLVFLTAIIVHSQEIPPPVRLVIIGLAHDAVGDFIQRVETNTSVQLVGIVESNSELVTHYARLYNFETNLFSPSLDDFLSKTNAQAAAVFSSTFDHRAIVEMCAAHGMDVMLEKPLAVDMEQAKDILTAAKNGGIKVIVDYETAWYPANQMAYSIVHNEHAIGELRKIIVCAGNNGPKESGCSDAFLAWLTDPKLDGGGALIDFGCYGADMATWLMNGQPPLTVSAVTQRFKPDIYSNVEDEATIVLSYANAQAIIQASWNWPFDRRDVEIYGINGYVLVPQMNLLRMKQVGTEESEMNLPNSPVPSPQTDDISYFAAVVRNEIQPSGMTSLDINMIATEILDAARESASTGKQIVLSPMDR